jgi:hypothetical protein
VIDAFANYGIGMIALLLEQAGVIVAFLASLFVRRWVHLIVAIPIAVLAHYILVALLLGGVSGSLDLLLSPRAWDGGFIYPLFGSGVIVLWLVVFATVPVRFKSGIKT